MLLKSFLTDLLNNELYKAALYDFEIAKKIKDMSLEDREELYAKLEQKQTEQAKFVWQKERSLKDDHFLAITWSMESNNEEGLCTLASFLMRLDLRGYNSRRLPVTNVLGEQKYHSLKALQRWWLDCLTRGYIIPELTEETLLVTGSWYRSLALSTLMDQFHKESPQKGSVYKLTEVQFKKHLLELLPEVDTDLYVVQMKTKNCLKPVTMLRLPKIEDCQKRLAKIIPGIEIFWNKSEEKPKNRTEGVDFTDPYCWVPEDFFGYQLRTAMTSFDMDGVDEFSKRELEAVKDPSTMTQNEPHIDVQSNFHNFLNPVKRRKLDPEESEEENLYS